MKAVWINIPCFRSDSCSVRRRRSLREASSSSLLSSLSASASLRAFSAFFSAIRCALLFLFAAASASAFAFRSASFLAFSRSTSESSASFQLSRTSLSSSSSSNFRLVETGAALTGPVEEEASELLSSSSIVCQRAYLGRQRKYAKVKECDRLAFPIDQRKRGE